MKRAFSRLTITLCMLAGLAAFALCIDTHWRWRTLYFHTTDATMWRIDSANGSLSLGHFQSWPKPLRFRYFGDLVDGPDGPGGLEGIINGLPAGTAPVFAMNSFGGAHSLEWSWWKLRGTTRDVCVVVKTDGSAWWDASLLALAVLDLNRYSVPMRFWEVKAPAWMVLAALWILPAMLLLRALISQILKSKRRPKGCCKACGYDLRASHGRCPEGGLISNQLPTV